MKKTVQPEQSCGTCKFYRHNDNGNLACFYDHPEILMINGNPELRQFTPGPAFWGCGHYLYSAEAKVFKAAPAASSTKTN